MLINEMYHILLSREGSLAHFQLNITDLFEKNVNKNIRLYQLYTINTLHVPFVACGQQMKSLFKRNSNLSLEGLSGSFS